MNGNGRIDVSAIIEELDVESENILEKASAFIFNLYKQKLSPHHVYHSWNHTLETAEAARKIGKKSSLSDEQLELVELAALFHDTGYVEKFQGHEQISSQIASEFLEKENYPSNKIHKVEELIAVTNIDVPPKTIEQEVLRDADLISMGKKRFFTRAGLLRHEWEYFLDRKYSDVEWERIQLDFLQDHDFYTSYAQKKFGERREKNIVKQREILSKKEEKHLKKERPRRGVETMYRSVYRTHINLSSIADSKANMMISINTIIVSIIVAAVGSGFTFSGGTFIDHVRFTVPLCILMVGSIISVIFAILSAKPNVTHKELDKEQIEKDEGSVLFFGNFTQMRLEQFVDHVRQLIKKRDALYDNMSVDLYFLGKVLLRKYRLLRISYTVFMTGLILCAASFLVIVFYTF